MREAAEEIGVAIDPAHVRFAHLIHHWTESSRMAIIFGVTDFTGDSASTEPDKMRRRSRR